MTLLNKVVSIFSRSAVEPKTKPVAFPATYLTLGRWVVTSDNRVGIIANLFSDTACEVHFTDAAGCTVAGDIVSNKDLRIAFRNEIPRPRRPDPARARTLGYFEN